MDIRGSMSVLLSEHFPQIQQSLTLTRIHSAPHITIHSAMTNNVFKMDPTSPRGNFIQHFNLIKNAFML